MNLENLKNIWNTEKITETPEISTEQQQKVRLPLEKIRKNMRLEFFMSLIALPIILLSIDLKYLFDYRFLILLFIALGITAYYYLKFYSFYKKTNTQEFGTYHNLLNLRYELVLNSELYKSYYLAFLPILLCSFMVIYPLPDSLFALIFLSGIVCMSVLILFISGKIWLHELYGKHIKEISNIVDSMNDEKDDFQYNRSIINLKDKLGFLTQFQQYCKKRFGKYGGLVYGFVVGIVGVLLFFLLSYALGYGIGYLAAKYDLIQQNDLEILIK